VAGVTIPPLKHFGPMLVIWGASMLLLFYIRDVGSSVMFFGAFLAMIYVATDRLSFVVVGVVTFAVGAYLVAGHIGHIADRIDAWQDPFDPVLLQRAQGGSYQLAQGLWAQADGGVLGQGFGQAVLRVGGLCASAETSTVNCSLLPAPHTDFIYAVIVNELGLVGAAGLLCVYLLVVQRGFKIAMLARDSFSKLLATGLTAVFALQVFVIVGGVTKLIPLTGVTLPFVSYGGSSVLANFVLLALLLLISDRARRDAELPA
jgi:cell division protein FtsW (lipid II flippase)